MRIILCEDNPDFEKRNLRVIEDFLDAENLEAEVKPFSRYDDALGYVKSLSHFEDCLYVLDIGLRGERNGLALGREIREIDGYKGEMIFVSGYGHQMGNVLKYKLRVLDFIDKGYKPEEELREDLKLFLRSYRDKMNGSHLVYKDGGQILQTRMSDILWIESDKVRKKVVIHTIKGDQSAGLALKEIPGMLSQDFIQIHRCTIVNKNHIEKLEQRADGLYARMSDGEEKAVSKRSEKEVKGWFI